jgi:SAM-dependent methyltransferase
MGKSISFDRAADIYEATRGFPAGIADQVADAALEIVGRDARVLEIGVGTGRIARPLVMRGLRVSGLDLSRKMMAELARRIPAGGPRPALTLGDATRLPLADGRFEAVLAVHVFHLIPDWPTVVTEARRALTPAGALMIGFDWRPPDSPGALLFERWREIVSAHGFEGRHPGARDYDDVKRYLLASGARLDERQVGEWQVTRTVAHALETIEHRTWSATWDVPEDFFPRCLAELRAWAVDRFGRLDEAYSLLHRFVWQAYRWPGRAPENGR